MEGLKFESLDEIFLDFRRVGTRVFMSVEELSVPIKGLGIQESAVGQEMPTDITVSACGKKFRCNAALLQKHSQHFRNSSLAEEEWFVTLAPSIFGYVSSWLSQSVVQVKRNDMLKLMNASHQLRIGRLTASLWDCLTNNNYYSEVHAFQCFVEAQALGNQLVSKLMVSRIGDSFLALVGTIEFAKLSTASLQLLLGNANNLGVHSELEVVYAIILWYRYNPMRTLNQLVRAMEPVRDNYLPVNFLSNMKENLFYSDICRYVIIILDDIKRPSQNDRHRHWIKDDLCPYFETLQRQEHVGFTEFVYYLKILQFAGPKHWTSVHTHPMKFEMKPAPKKCRWRIYDERRFQYDDSTDESNSQNITELLSEE